uniref:Uncharacterized protein n=1 Tax=Octopus bimaculoides TaxID=37653 RepID=A0A0L8GB37_OCTBM
MDGYLIDVREGQRTVFDILRLVIYIILYITCNIILILVSLNLSSVPITMKAKLPTSAFNISFKMELQAILHIIHSY